MSEEDMVRLVTAGQFHDGLFVDEMSQTIRQYNDLVDDDQKIKIKGAVFEHHIFWNIPKDFLELDVEKYVIDMFEYECGNGNLTDEQMVARSKRIAQELKLYQQHNLFDVIRTLIYVINTLRNNNIVWGVGRGSSVSSYVLYLIGVHDVDSVEYQLDIKEFLRTE